MKKLRITVDNKVYEVTVEVLEEQGAAPSLATAAPAASLPAAAPAQASVSAPPAPAAKPAAASGGAGAVPSPLAGRVVAIHVQAGQQVAEGDQLVTLEAMKMNTYIYAPHAGKVVSIPAQVGAAVQEGEALVVLG